MPKACGGAAARRAGGPPDAPAPGPAQTRAMLAKRV